MTDKQIIIYKKECYNEPYCSLNQVLEQLNAYKMEADEGKEINAELKAELTRANCQIADDEVLQCDMRETIEELKAENVGALKQLEFVRTLNTVKEAEIRKLSKTLTEIKELIHFNKTNRLSGGACISIEQILQKINECEE